MVVAVAADAAEGEGVESAESFVDEAVATEVTSVEASVASVLTVASAAISVADEDVDAAVIVETSVDEDAVGVVMGLQFLSTTNLLSPAWEESKGCRASSSSISEHRHTAH
jgi:hypothetical protein